MRLVPGLRRVPWREQQGITGLETAIVLIAFVVVSSVFAFAALSTGLFATDASKATITGGLMEARGTLQVRGTMVAKASGDAIDEVKFQVSNAAGGEAVNITPGDTIIIFTDESQSITLTGDDFTATGLGNADADALVEPGEIFEIKITGLIASLIPDLKKRTTFSLEVIPQQGAVLHIERRTPIVIDPFNDLG